MHDHELQLIVPPVYFLALCGLQVPEDGGMVREHSGKSAQ